MLNILNIVLPTFIVIIIGFILGKVKKLDMSVVVELLFWIGIPVLAFTAMTSKNIVLLDASKIWLSALIVMAGTALVAMVAFRLTRMKHSGLYVPIIILNAVNIPFPVMQMAYGQDGLQNATLFYIPVTLLSFSVGIMILSRRNWKDGLLETAKVPAIYGAVLGLAVNLLHIKVPDLVLQPLTVIGSIVIPLTLLVLGYRLSSVKITDAPATALASAIRVGGGLGFGLLSVTLLGLTGVPRSVVILDAAMPSAANTSILAMKYGNEAELVSSVVFVTTVASLLIIPLLLYILGA
jgi:malate permease and related proteins